MKAASATWEFAENGVLYTVRFDLRVDMVRVTAGRDIREYPQGTWAVGVEEARGFAERFKSSLESADPRELVEQEQPSLFDADLEPVRWKDDDEPDKERCIVCGSMSPRGDECDACGG